MSDVGTEAEAPVIVSWGQEPPKIRKKPHPWDPIVDEVRSRKGEWAEVQTGDRPAASKVTQLRKRHPDMEITQRGDSVWIRLRTDEDIALPDEDDDDLLS